MQTRTLRPGLLVSLKTDIKGNVKYDRVDIEPDHVTTDGIKKAVWETKRFIMDPEEYEKAVTIRSKCRTLVVGVCTPSEFGLLCAEDRKPELDAAIQQAQELVQWFNERATMTRIGVYVIAGRIAADDVQAVRAINSEVRDLIEAMETGLQNLDVQAVRKAAQKAKSLGQMLSPDAASKIKAAVDTARDVAKRMVKAGEEAAKELDEAVMHKLKESRTAFLDIEGEHGEVAAPTNTARALDLEPEDAPVVPRPKGRMRLPLEVEG